MAGTRPGAGWRRAALLYSLDDGASWHDGGETAAPAIVGTLASRPDAAPATLADLRTIIEVDLEKQEIKGPDGGTVHFELDPFRKRCLLEGLDDIGLTMEKKSEIDDFEKKQREAQPWLHAAE